MISDYKGRAQLIQTIKMKIIQNQKWQLLSASLAHRSLRQTTVTNLRSAKVMR